MSALTEANKIVVKVGTSTLTYENGRLNLQRIGRLVRVLSDLKNSGKEIVLVSSGAIMAGVSALGLSEKPQDTPGKQAAAAVGQCALMHLYDNLFGEYGHSVGQVLLTGNAAAEGAQDNILNTFNRLFDYKAVPIVNENDTVAVQEIEFGDNDALSAFVSVTIGADLLIILSDIDGLYDKNPKTNPDAALIPRVTSIEADMLEAAGPPGSGRGTGGMVTKLAAACTAMEHNIPMVILNGSEPENIYGVFKDEVQGTLFMR